MQKFDELTQHTVLQNVFIKLWKLLVKAQYKAQYENERRRQKQNDSLREYSTDFVAPEEDKNLLMDSQVPTLPVDIKIYQQCIPQFKKVLGAMFDTDEFVAQSPTYKNKHIFFDRFCYDMVSLLGSNVNKLGVLDIEYVFRTTYLTLSHSFGPNQGIKLLQYDSILSSPFSIEQM